jgi:hypothetical protein
MVPLQLWLGSIPGAVENKVTSRIHRVPDSDQAIYVQWPVDAFFLFELGTLTENMCTPSSTVADFGMGPNV